MADRSILSSSSGHQDTGGITGSPHPVVTSNVQKISKDKRYMLDPKAPRAFTGRRWIYISSIL